MKHTQKRMICNITSCLLLIALLLSCIPGTVFAASVSGDTYDDTVDHYSSYSTITVIGSIGSCPAMQGLALDGTYLYTAKTNDGDTTVTLSRTHKTTGDMVYLTNAANGTNYFYQLAHANDLAYCEIDGVKTLFVATGGAGVGEYSLVRFALNGTTATEVGHYNVKYNGSESYLAGVKVMSVNENDIDLIFKRGKYIFKGTVGKSTTSGDLNVDLLCTLDLANSTINGSAMDLSAWVQQGFGYIDNKIFVPLSGNHQDTTTDTSLIMVYDIEGVSGAITNDPSLSVMITDPTFVDLFEIESCQIDPSDGKLYFNTNRRKTSSDGNHDGIHYVNNYVYDPARGDTASSAYRWEVIDDQLLSVTDDGAVFNAPCKKGGYISGGTFNSARYYLSRSVILKHDEPWVLEWKNTGGWSSGALLFSNNAKGAYEGNRFLYRRQNNSIIALGEYSGGAYNNYGIELATAGVDGTVTHTYTLKNRIATDGTNMVYLFVDGKEIGPMNNYFINSTSQGTTSDWISGKDFTFSYLGSMGHPIKNCAIDYIQVWGKGYIDQYDEPNTFRWETNGSAVSTVTETGYTTNNATALSGTCSSGVLSGYRATLDESITLLHDRPWSIEWQNDSWSGSGMILSTHERVKVIDTPYLYRSSSILAIGYFDGTGYNNYGIKLADHGIDPAGNHTFRLTNRIAADGSNMVYLFVDGVEVGPMNGHYIGNTYQNVTSDWISGQDFSFPCIGNLQYPISAPMSYLQVWEGGVPQDMTFGSHRWEPQNNVLTSITTDGNVQNTATVINGTLSGTTFSDSWYALDESIVLLHDNAWSIKWRSQGTWKDTANGAMFLASSLVRNQPNAAYLYRRNGSTFIAFGERRDGAHQNYGVSLSGHGIDGTVDHTYELINRVSEDGTNMVYLFVDGVEIGPMNEYFLGGTAQGTTSDWVCGKDFVFSYMGTPQFPIDNCSIDYIQINEGHEHTYGDWTDDSATCTESATQTRTCISCGDTEERTVAATGHDYTATVTAPTCTADGHTTYTCQNCGDSYSETIAAIGHSYATSVTAPTCTENGFTTHTCSCGDTYTDTTTAATGHTWADGSCVTCGEDCAHKYANNVCTICGMKKPTKDYYLFGYINGADYACEGDYENLGIYKFKDGKLTAFFTQDSYVAIKSGDNQDWYMLSAYYGENVTAGTLFNTSTGAAEKLFVPGGKDITFTLMDNGDDTYTLSYVATACTHPIHDTSGSCTKCGTAVEHTYGEWLETKSATCTEKGELKRTCTICTAYQLQSIAATGHSYSGGTCAACGEADPNAVTQPTLTLKYPSLSFEAEILYNVYYVAENIDDVEEMGLATFDSENTDGTVDTASDVIPGFESDGTIWKVGTNGISAKNLGDTVYFKVYAKLTDGSYVYSAMKSYSAVSYATTILGRSTSSTYMKSLVVAMLNYGTEAQLYFGHNTDYLMNAGLTADQQALVGAYDESMMDNVVSVDSTKAQNFIYDGSSFTRRAPSVSFDGAFSINYYFTAANAPDDGMTLYYWNIDDYLAADVLTIDNATGSMEMLTTETENQYWGNVTGIAAKELDQTVFVVGVYQHEGVTYTTGILNYSIGKYCEGIAAKDTSDQQTFAQATAVYGFYAKEYFSNL